LDEGERMADLAASLGAPGIRVFGEKVQPGADLASTRSWIAQSIRELSDRVAATGVEVWLETHGDFASAAATTEILLATKSLKIGVVWDPANCFVETGEKPSEGGIKLGAGIRHVHVKDLCKKDDEWKPELTGKGDFPLLEVRSVLSKLNYDAFVSFEWEKKWHPGIAEANIAVPHFSRWFRENW
jgi:sugar phosphate isomerase/epimerase